MSEPGLRQRRRCRATGTTVALYDAAAPGADFTPADGGRWVTVCEDHSFLVQHPTLALARDHAAAPDGWCDECRDAVAL